MLAEAVQQRRTGGWLWDQAVGVALRGPERDVVPTLEQIRDRMATASESKPLQLAIHHCPGSQQFERQAEKAEAAGKAKDAEKARASAAQWREWAETAAEAVTKKR